MSSKLTTLLPKPLNLVAHPAFHDAVPLPDEPERGKTRHRLGIRIISDSDGCRATDRQAHSYRLTHGGLRRNRIARVRSVIVVSVIGFDQVEGFMMDEGRILSEQNRRHESTSLNAMNLCLDKRSPSDIESDCAARIRAPLECSM